MHMKLWRGGGNNDLQQSVGGDEMMMIALFVRKRFLHGWVGLFSTIDLIQES